MSAAVHLGLGLSTMMHLWVSNIMYVASQLVLQGLARPPSTNKSFNITCLGSRTRDTFQPEHNVAVACCLAVRRNDEIE